MKFKAYVLLIILTLSLFSSLSAQASDATTNLNVDVENYYYETIIEDIKGSRAVVPNLPVESTTKTKTVRMKDSSGNVLWSVSITATFTYDGTTATCTSCTPSATSYASAWSIKSISSSKSGNSATAKAIATNTAANGSTQDITKSVTITCSPTGVVS